MKTASYKKMFSILLVSVCVVVGFGTACMAEVDNQDISIGRFDIVPGGNCLYTLHNNTDQEVVVSSFRLTEAIDAIDNEYTPSLSIPSDEEKGGLYGDPAIEALCGEEGQPYSFDCVITYTTDSGETVTIDQRLIGVCKNF